MRRSPRQVNKTLSLPSILKAVTLYPSNNQVNSTQPNPMLPNEEVDNDACEEPETKRFKVLHNTFKKLSTEVSSKAITMPSQSKIHTLVLDKNTIEIPDSDSKENARKRPHVSDHSEDDHDEMFNYMQIREQNLRANENFFASLGIKKAKEVLEQSTVKKKTQPTHRGLKVHKKPQEPNPCRYSLRVRQLNPVGNTLPQPSPFVEIVKESRLAPGPIGMKECAYSKSDEMISQEYVHSISSLICDKKSTKIAPVSINQMFKSALEKATITDNRVAKVVPGRAFSLAWHPSSQSLISVAGDKNGYIGIWDVTASESTGQDIVRAFRCHIKPVSDLFVPPADPHKLYSCSYDSTLRCGNFEREVFDVVFSVPEEDDDLFRNFSFIDGTSTMLVSQFSGNVSLVDVRTPTTCAEQVYSVSRKSLRTVSVHPTQPHYFITAGVDTNIAVWDLRSITPKSPKPVQLLEHHTKAISSAYFSPAGHKVLSCAADDTILVYSVDNGMKLDLTKRIRHNNFTGRWLTKFQPNWHPTVDDVFVSGSMHRPRQIEVFNSDGDLLKALSDEDFLGSVCSLNAFHPNRTCTLVGANSSGRLHVFM